MFHCFGCGAGGDVFTFRHELRRTDIHRRGADSRWPRQRSDRRGASLRSCAAPRSSARRSRSVCRAVMKRQLILPRGARRSEGRVARAVPSAQREISTRRVEAFGLGYAPAGWDALTSRLEGAQRLARSRPRRLGWSRASRSGDGYYDRFRDRIIFPVHDAAGRRYRPRRSSAPGSAEGRAEVCQLAGVTYLLEVPRTLWLVSCSRGVAP